MKGSLRLTLLSAIGSLLFTQAPAQSVRLADGTVYFLQSPTLLKASTTQNTANTCLPIYYYFSIAIPENAGEPLGRVVITPDPAIDPLFFYLKQTTAFEGTRDRKEARTGIDPVTMDPKTQAITVAFNPPVPPGKTVTISLSPQCNPYAGVYLYGVTAYPAGNPAHGQFVGYGRLSFYSIW